MAKMPEPMHATVREIWRLHERRRADDPPRDYLGGSEIGHTCKRRLWLSFRHAEYPRWDGRMLRLFGTGHREEARLIEELRAVGVEVLSGPKPGEQFEVRTAGGHVKGHLDGVLRGLVEAPKTWHLLEVKTHNAKSYAEVVKKGVRAAKPLHYAQMQFYMGMERLDRAAYFAINKDTDEIHLERIEFDPVEFARIMDAIHEVVFAAEPTPRISDDPTWYECRFCPFYQLCHGDDVPRVNCRTCAHATPMNDGTWHCAQHNHTLTFDEQMTGCDDHRYIPKLVERVLEFVSAEGNDVAWRIVPTGALIRQPEYLSSELRDAEQWEFLTLAWTQDIKRIFGARVVESRGDAWEAPPRVTAEDGLGADDIPW